MLQVLGFGSLRFAIATQRLLALRISTHRADHGVRHMVGIHFAAQKPRRNRHRLVNRRAHAGHP